MDQPNYVEMEEIVSLNVEELDVEELENRLELAAAIPDSCWGFACGANQVV